MKFKIFKQILAIRDVFYSDRVWITTGVWILYCNTIKETNQQSEKNDEVFFFFKAVFDVSQTEELTNKN